MEIGDLFEEVFVADDGFAETDVFTDKQDDKEDDAADDRIGQQDGNGRKDPAKDVEAVLVTIELLNIKRDIKKLGKAGEQSGNAIPQRA